MKLETLDGLGSVAPADWNALVPADNPFLRHEFLRALEESGSVGPGTGWQPCPLVARDRHGGLAAAVPLYLKDHSFGEYVFDFAWANAALRAGVPYYPKLVAAVPFSPVSGPRLLISAHADRASCAALLTEGARELAARVHASSLHWLFVDTRDLAVLEAGGWMPRAGLQFHWSNPGYRDFGDFLSAFTAEKRKKLKRERRAVREAGIEMKLIEGSDIPASLWDRFFDFHLATIEAHGGQAYLRREFFHWLGATLPQQVRLVVAERGSRVIAAALFLEGTESLYGRYWGASEQHSGLHFETCYYTAIEYCIKRGLKRFEAGAQGEHKLARGFVPTPTWSAHSLHHPGLARAVADFLARERNGVAHAISELGEHAPYKSVVQTGEAGSLTGGPDIDLY